LLKIINASKAVLQFQLIFVSCIIYFSLLFLPMALGSASFGIWLDLSVALLGGFKAKA